MSEIKYPSCNEDWFDSEASMRQHHMQVHDENLVETLTFVCEWCRDDERADTQIDGAHFCSQECSTEWRRAEGDRSVHTEDGRDEALTRHNHKCKKCGEDTDIEVHNLIPWSAEGPDKADNLVSLYSKCHSWVHGAGISQLLEERDDLYRELREAVCDEE